MTIQSMDAQFEAGYDEGYKVAAGRNENARKPAGRSITFQRGWQKGYEDAVEAREPMAGKEA